MAFLERLGFLVPPLILLGTMGASDLPSRRDAIEVHFILFGLDAQTPVTKGSIEDDAWCRFEVDAGSEDATTLRRYLADFDPGTFDGETVRVKISGLEAESGDIYVDDTGSVKRGHQSQESQLSEEAFRGLSLVLRDLAERSGCKPYRYYREAIERTEGT